MTDPVSNSDPAFCFKCQKDLSSLGSRIGRRDECPHCRAAVHACKNCRFWDQKAYNECHESQADRVVDKERENFCDFFSLRRGAPNKAGEDPKLKALRDLDKLFK